MQCMGHQVRYYGSCCFVHQELSTSYIWSIIIAICYFICCISFNLGYLRAILNLFLRQQFYEQFHGRVHLSLNLLLLHLLWLDVSLFAGTALQSSFMAGSFIVFTTYLFQQGLHYVRIGSFLEQERYQGLLQLLQVRFSENIQLRQQYQHLCAVGMVLSQLYLLFQHQECEPEQVFSIGSVFIKERRLHLLQFSIMVSIMAATR